MPTDTPTIRRCPSGGPESIPISIAIAVAAAGAAVAFRFALSPVFGADRGLYIIAAAAVLVAAVFAGPWSGVLATLLIAFAIYFIWFPPRYTFHVARPSDLLVLAIFVAVGLTVSALAGRLRRAKHRAENLARDEVRARVAAQQSEEQFRRIFEQAPIGIALATNDRRISDANPMFCQMLGYPLAELRGRTIESLTFPPDVDESVERVQQLYDGRTSNYSYVKRYLRKTGQPFWAMVSVTVVRDAGGRATHSLAMVQDVTDRKRLEHALQHAKEQAESASRAKDQFLAVLSHELRTPLSPVLLTAGAMEDDPMLPPTVRDNARLIRQNVEIEARLIDDLLDLTGIARGKLTLHRTRVHVHDVIRRALVTVRQDLIDGGLRVHCHLAAPRGTVDGDPARLQQVFWNLLKNATKFTPAGGAITLRSYNASDAAQVLPHNGVPLFTQGKEPAPAGPDGSPGEPTFLVVEVEDTGAGIAPDVLPRLFRPFEQGPADITRHFGGLGLGLAISRSIVELHGGQISVASPGPGRGATFTVRLPLAPVLAPAPPTPSPPPHPTPPHLGPLRVLLVEDHPATRRAMASILQSLGHNVRACATVAEALTLAGNDAFDLVISDLALPDGSGHDLMRRLKSGDHPPHGIAVSGYGMPDDVRRSRDAGFDEHLTKPVSREKIREVLAHVGT